MVSVRVVRGEGTIAVLEGIMSEVHFVNATVNAVMVHGMWFSVMTGTWEVFTGGDFRRAAWTDLNGIRYSAFLAHVEMVRHTTS